MNDERKTQNKEPTSIAFCITDLDPGGAERALVQIVTRLDRATWSPYVLCLGGEGTLAGTLRDAGVPVMCFHAKRWWPWGLVSKLAARLREIQPAILQTFLYHANIAGRWAARKANVPNVVSGIRVAERRSRWRLWLDRKTEHLVDRHLCVSKGVAEFSATRGGLSREKLIVIPNGVDYERFAHAQRADLSEFGIPQDHQTVLSVGRLDPQKGVMTLLHAFAELSRSLNDAHLLLVGDGPLRWRAEQFVAKRELQNCVHFAGYRDDVPQLMKSADCLALASLWEGMPNVLLEAMASGLPVISTRVEGTPEIIRENETGRLVAVEDATSLQVAIASCLKNREESAKMAQTAQTIVVNEFAWEKVADSYQKIYRELTTSVHTNTEIQRS